MPYNIKAIENGVKLSHLSHYFSLEMSIICLIQYGLKSHKKSRIMSVTSVNFATGKRDTYLKESGAQKSENTSVLLIFIYFMLFQYAYF